MRTYKTLNVLKPAAPARRGTALIYLTLIMSVLTAMVFLGVDVAEVRVVKNQLQCAADSAVRYGAGGLATNVATAQSNAVSAAGANYAGGTSVVLTPSTDVQFGSWSGGTFTVLTGAAQSTSTAIRIIARRTAATGNAVHLSFGGMLGITSADITASATAIYHPGIPNGLTGLSSITIHDNFFLGSYNSSTTVTPTQATSLSSGLINSNGAITGHSGDVVHGTANMGPSGSISLVTATTTNYQSTAVPTPTVTMNNVTNPGSVAVAPSIAASQSVTWPGGTYYFTSLTMANQGTINFSGAATVYLNGALTIGDQNNIIAYNHIPANLVVYQSSGQSNSIHDSNNIYCEWIAPGDDFQLSHDHNNWYGSLLANTITLHDNENFFMDSAIPATGVSIAVVQ